MPLNVFRTERTSEATELDEQSQIKGRSGLWATVIHPAGDATTAFPYKGATSGTLPPGPRCEASQASASAELRKTWIASK